MTRAPGFVRNEDGAVLVEFAVVAGLFMFLLFGLIDFARLGFSNVMAEKATEAAVRMAVVRPPACTNLTKVIKRGTLGLLALDLPNGTRCSARSGLCSAPQTVRCAGNLGQPTVAAIWAQVQPLLPGTATPANLQFSYSYDSSLNRVGATYVPVVTVDIVNLNYAFISPLGALAAFAGDPQPGDLGQGFVFPSMSASLVAEDLR